MNETRKMIDIKILEEIKKNNNNNNTNSWEIAIGSTYPSTYVNDNTLIPGGTIHFFKCFCL